MDTRRELAILRGHTARVHALAFIPDGRRLASGGREGAILLWDSATRRLTCRIGSHIQRINALAFAPDGRTLASASYDRTIKLWHAGRVEECGAALTRR